MIYVEIHGRLGNQFFQYATARYLQIRTGQNIVLRFGKVNGSNTEGKEGWENSLRFFRLSSYEVDNRKKSIIFCMPLHKMIVSLFYALGYRRFKYDLKRTYIYQLKYIDKMDKLGIWWISNGYYKFSYDKENYYLNGSFESKLYFDEIREVLLKEIIPINDPLKQNYKLLKTIKNTNPVCVSLRHFQISEDRINDYEVCTKKYYLSAINVILKHVDNPLFIVFSDDIIWAKKTLPITGNVIYEKEGNPLWEKVRLMSSCKHFIIPNSSFAWWMQYLGTYENKIVIGPERWFNNDFVSPLVDEIWIKIDKEGNVLGNTYD